MDQVERFRGCLLGLAAGDALGVPLEFLPPGSFKPIDDMVGGGYFNLKPGQWTDDTSMALCLAESLIGKRDFVPIDQLTRYMKWYREGHLSSTGKCFSMGARVKSAIKRFEKTGEPYCGSTRPKTASNGSLMRLGPVVLFYAEKPAKAIEMSGESSRTTHGALASMDACRYLGALMVGALRGTAKEELLSDHYTPADKYWARKPLGKDISEVASGSFRRKNPPEIRGTGHAPKSLEAALWAFYHSTSFKEGALLAVNLGDDADTTGAVYGQLAGVFYGEQGIPEAWRSRLALRPLIESFADQLYILSKSIDSAPEGSSAG
jgi:ADP-ribosyl-[dinitrogen reductase] hydrolase